MPIESCTVLSAVQLSKLLFYLPDISHGEEKIPISVSFMQVCQSSDNVCMYVVKNEYTIELEIFARRKFSPISPPDLVGENFLPRIFCPVLMIT